jgi:hypothetical protein
MGQIGQSQSCTCQSSVLKKGTAVDFVRHFQQKVVGEFAVNVRGI